MGTDDAAIHGHDGTWFRPTYGGYRMELSRLGLAHWADQQRKLVAEGKLVQTDGGGLRVPVSKSGAAEPNGEDEEAKPDAPKEEL